MAAGAELARVLAEERPRDLYYSSERRRHLDRTAARASSGVNQGNGVWHLAPIVITPARAEEPLAMGRQPDSDRQSLAWPKRTRS